MPATVMKPIILADERGRGNNIMVATVMELVVQGEG
jgi:hypothetical protein